MKPNCLDSNLSSSTLQLSDSFINLFSVLLVWVLQRNRTDRMCIYMYTHIHGERSRDRQRFYLRNWLT